MKKNKFMAVFAAAAIAFTSIITPTDIGTDLDLTASAAVAPKTTGGITLTRVGATDVFESDEEYISMLKPKDLVQVNILIPDLENNLVDMTLRLKYSSDVFDAVQWVWYASDEPGGSALTPETIKVGDSKDSRGNFVYSDYKTTDGYPTSPTGNTTVKTDKWRLAGYYIQGFSGEIGYTDGQLSITTWNPQDDTADDAPIDVFNKAVAYSKYNPTRLAQIYTQDDSGNWFFKISAVLRVKGGIDETADFTVELINEATVEVNEAAGVDTGLSAGVSPTMFTYDPNPGNGDVAEQFNLWTPDYSHSSVCGKVTNAVIRKISGIDFSVLETNDDGYPLNWQNNPIVIHVYKPDDPVGGSNVDPGWFVDDPVETTYSYMQTVNVTIDSDGKTGIVEIRGLTPGTTYKLKPNIWCLYDEILFTPNSTFIDDKTSSTNTSDFIDIHLYGDVDHNGVIAAKDATYTLKYIVGKNVNNIITYSNGVGNDGYKAANVYAADLLNARDATQILRKTAGKASIFDSMPA